MKRLRQTIEMAGPGWFTSVMGVVLLALRAAIARGGLAATLRDPAVAQLWGAPPMAAFTVAVGLMRIAVPHGGGELAIAIAQVLFVAGALGAVLTAFYVPFLMMTKLQIDSDHALGTWLLPVVPPVVAAVPAALLLPTFPEALRSTILAFAYAMLGLGVALAALIVGVFSSRLLFAKLPTGSLAPSMWIVVGPLGQIAAASAHGASAAVVWPGFGRGLETGAVVYEIGATVLLVLLAATWTIVAARTARVAIRARVAAPAAAPETPRQAAA
jgi:tellurite resistance protein TehA-like permease